MEFLAIGIVSALNLIIIVSKFRRKRYEDGIFDVVLFACLTLLFSGSLGGMTIAMIGSFIVSLYLLIFPPTFFRDVMTTDKAKETVKQVTKSSNNEPKNFLYTAAIGIGLFAVTAAGIILSPLLAMAAVLVPTYFVVKLLNTDVDDDTDAT